MAATLTSARGSTTPSSPRAKALACCRRVRRSSDCIRTRPRKRSLRRPINSPSPLPSCKRCDVSLTAVPPFLAVTRATRSNGARARLSRARRPCCVFPNAFAWRRCADGRAVRTYDAFCDWLCEQAPGSRVAFLPFTGRNRVIYRTADAANAEDHLAPRSSEHDTANAAVLAPTQSAPSRPSRPQRGGGQPLLLNVTLVSIATERTGGSEHVAGRRLGVVLRIEWSRGAPWERAPRG